jgi:hypothetical protein
MNQRLRQRAPTGLLNGPIVPTVPVNRHLFLRAVMATVALGATGRLRVGVASAQAVPRATFVVESGNPGAIPA